MFVPHKVFLSGAGTVDLKYSAERECMIDGIHEYVSHPIQYHTLYFFHYQSPRSLHLTVHSKWRQQGQFETVSYLQWFILKQAKKNYRIQTSWLVACYSLEFENRSFNA